MNPPTVFILIVVFLALCAAFTLIRSAVRYTRWRVAYSRLRSRIVWDRIRGGAGIETAEVIATNEARAELADHPSLYHAGQDFGATIILLFVAAAFLLAWYITGGAL